MRKQKGKFDPFLTDDLLSCLHKYTHTHTHSRLNHRVCSGRSQCFCWLEMDFYGQLHIMDGHHPDLFSSSCSFSWVALMKHTPKFKNSSCLINDVYRELSVSSCFSWSFLFSCLLCDKPADRWFCCDKCEVCISHGTAGQPIITVHFPWLCKPL